MSKFYFFLWLRWAIRLCISSVAMASLVSLIITAILYFSKDMPSLDDTILQALLDVFKFWFPISWSFTLLIALFRSLKYIFNRCIAGYELKLLECNSDAQEYIEDIGYGNLLRVWRRWFLALIWLVGSLMIFALAFTHLFSSYNGVFEWFNIYWLFSFILIAGYFSFILMSAKCKKIKVKIC